jgi:quercetin dioxygenase-like cupin family protein
MKRIVLIINLVFISFHIYAQYNNGIKIEKVLNTDTTTIGQKIVYPQFSDNHVTMLKITIPPGASTGWHKHTIPVFAYIIKGNLTVTFEDGKSFNFIAGNSIAESLNVNHNGINQGNEDVELIAIYLGEKGKPLSIPAETK